MTANSKFVNQWGLLGGKQTCNDMQQRCNVCINKEDVTEETYNLVGVACQMSRFQIGYAS